MKFVNFKVDDSKKIGILKDEKTIVAIDEFMIRLAEESNIDPSTVLNKHMDMNYIIDNWHNSYLQVLEDFVLKSDQVYDMDKVEILAPIEYPKRNIFCLGKNYLDHALEVKGLKGSEDELPKFPIYFSKIANPAVGHNAMILSHSNITEMLDYEVELAVIIGKDGIDIPYEEAEDYIFGYTIVNDISARNIQRKHGQWFKGKCLDTHCPMGPVIVHKSEIPFPVKLDIKCYINDELRQNSNTEKLIFDIPTIISDLSKGMHLNKGDIIITGTPSGVGLGFKPFKFLKSGDKVVCEIEKIGVLENHIL